MRLSPTRILLLTLVLVAASCNDEPAAPSELDRQMDALRDVTRAYQSFESARAAGYTAKITECMADAQGGMGYHYGKEAFIDGTAKALEPEVVMYEPMANGTMKLVGVEYVIPFTAWKAAEPPTLYGQSFQRNETFQVWALHVWLWKDNPRGLFASWNPDVTCATNK